MKLAQDFLNKPLGEVMETLNNPEKQKDMTFGDVMQLLSIMETAANAQAKLKNPQSIPSDMEVKMRNLELRIKALEDMLNAIYEAFTGGHDYD